MGSNGLSSRDKIILCTTDSNRHKISRLFVLKDQWRVAPVFLMKLACYYIGIDSTFKILYSTDRYKTGLGRNEEVQ